MADDGPQPLPQEMPASALPSAAEAEFEERIARLEEKLAQDQLSYEGQVRDLFKEEIKQRILNRQIAVALAIVTMLFMAGVLACVTSTFLWGRFLVLPQSVAIALFLAPVVSITTLAVVLIVGAFRKFKDEDMSNVSLGSIAAEAARNSM